jgi:hypothetical protein
VPLVRLAALATSLTQPPSHVDPLRVRPERCLPADSVFPGHPRPRGQVGRGGELTHVRADLGHDDLGGALVDPGDGVQQRHLLSVRGDQLLDPLAQQGNGLV